MKGNREEFYRIMRAGGVPDAKERIMLALGDKEVRIMAGGSYDSFGAAIPAKRDAAIGYIGMKHGIFPSEAGVILDRIQERRTALYDEA